MMCDTFQSDSEKERFKKRSHHLTRDLLIQYTPSLTKFIK